MSMTLAIWKWRPLWPFRIGSHVMRMIEKDRAPLGLARFDAQALAEEIRQRFGGDDEHDPQFIVEVRDFTGHRVNWIMLECGWSVPENDLAELTQLCARRGLHVHAA